MAGSTPRLPSAPSLQSVSERLPGSLVTRDIWQQRFEDICGFENYLAHNGVVVRKFFLNVSKKEQKRRFMERLDSPEKNWKFSAADVKAAAVSGNRL